MAATHDPVFRSVGQALAFSFYIQYTAMATKGSTQIVIEDLLKRSGEWLDRQAPADRAINFGTLSPQEVRGQCAMVRQSVETHLNHQVERDAIHARFAYQQQRALGVRGLRDYFACNCVTQSEDAILALLWAIYKPSRRRGDEWSLRTIEREYHVPKTSLHRDQRLLRERCQLMENRASTQLEELYVRNGLIGDPAYA
jgi:hypothetical protein